METQINSFEEENWNEDILADIKPANLSSLVVFSRDWTVETIISQIDKGNIDLNPKFQRRNAWKDDKRSRLIESLIIGIPIPEVVFAEHPKKKNSFIVIDGKQRLLTIAGFINHDEFQYWKSPELSKLKVRKDLNGRTYKELSNSDEKYQDELRAFQNADMRCTVISNYTSDDVLYDIFYRLNAGSVPLSTQELRQVLNKGPFADWLMEVTNELQPIHSVLGLSEPDPRLKDIEIIFRFLAINLFGNKYKGNLKNFLDMAMSDITSEWDNYKSTVVNLYNKLNNAIKKLEVIMGSNHIGRKLTNKKWDHIFNKALFEIEVYYFSFISDDEASRNKENFYESFNELCNRDSDFRRAIEVGTNALESYQDRFRLFRDFINKVFNTKIQESPILLTKSPN